MAKKVHCPVRGRYCRVRQRSPKSFARGSLRTVKRGGVRIVIGCPKGKFKRGRCSVGTKAQTILYPKGHKKCAPCR